MSGLTVIPQLLAMAPFALFIVFVNVAQSGWQTSHLDWLIDLSGVALWGSAMRRTVRSAPDKKEHDRGCRKNHRK